MYLSEYLPCRTAADWYPQTKLSSTDRLQDSTAARTFFNPSISFFTCNSSPNSLSSVYPTPLLPSHSQSCTYSSQIRQGVPTIHGIVPNNRRVAKHNALVDLPQKLQRTSLSLRPSIEPNHSWMWSQGGTHSVVLFPDFNRLFRVSRVHREALEFVSNSFSGSATFGPGLGVDNHMGFAVLAFVGVLSVHRWLPFSQSLGRHWEFL